VKRTIPFLSLLAGLSVLSGYLLSKATLIGRTGINLFYKEYQFLKTWWKGALAVFAGLLILFFLLGMAQRKLPRRKAVIVHAVTLVMAIVGLYFTYSDFRNTLSHRLLGERFHLGAYLFWIGWMLISLFYLVQPKPDVQLETTPTGIR
jgi:hypothetical protein